DLLPAFRRHLADRTFLDVEPGIVDKDIDRAEHLEDAVDEEADLAGVPDIGGMMQDAAAKRVGGPAQLVGTATTDRYARPLLEEEARCRQSDAAAPAGDQYGLVLQIAHAELSPSLDDDER